MLHARAWGPRGTSDPNAPVFEIYSEGSKAMSYELLLAEVLYKLHRVWPHVLPERNKRILILALYCSPAR